MRLHIPSLPHTETTRDFCWCAYTEKVRKLGAMLRSRGHEVILYAGENNEADVTEHVTVVTHTDWKRWFDGPWPTSRVFNRWDPAEPWWTEMNRAVIIEMHARLRPGDILGIIGGRSQEVLVKAFPEMHAIEWGVGYAGVVTGTFRAYESVAWRHYVHGYLGDTDGHSFDAVIPNSFDPADLAGPVTDPYDYLLYLGRPTWKKGLAIVAELAKRHRVLTAGQSDPEVPGTEYVGLVRGAEKADLIARARAVLVPTQYIEPFGGVAVEALMSGAPVITSDWGAFTETVVHGVNGYRCNTLADYLAAADNVQTLNRRQIAACARREYSTDTVAELYDAWLRRLALLDRGGWSAL